MDISTHPALLVTALLLAPATVAGVALLVGVRRSPERLAGALGAAGVVLGYVVGHAASLDRLPTLPPASSNESLGFAALIVGIGALVAARVERVALRWTVIGLFQVAATALLLRTQLGTLGPAALALHVAVAFGGAATVALASERFGERTRGPGAPLLLWAAVTACAGCIALTGSAKYAQFGASLAAVLGAAAVVGVLVRQARFAGGTSNFAVAQLALLALAATQFSELPLDAGAALALAPLAPALLPARTLAARTPVARWSLLALSLALPLGYALWRCWQVHSASAASSYYGT
ncbi:MAG: hypothetical protein NTV21_18995 [Planctomycetota bacterium]|nr:hypothetical protein [Planctomycetota bacterium]